MAHKFTSNIITAVNIQSNTRQYIFWACEYNNGHASEIYWGADKSLVWLGRKQATATKLLQATQKHFGRLSVQPGLRGSNDLRVGRKMATFQLFLFQSGRAKDLSAPLYEYSVHRVKTALGCEYTQVHLFSLLLRTEESENKTSFWFIIATNIIPHTAHSVTLFYTQDVSEVAYTLIFSCMVVIILAVVLLLCSFTGVL